MNFEARPRVVGRREGRPADERVPPVGPAAARTGVHLHPVVVEIEDRVGTAVAPHRLHGEGDPIVSERSDSSLRVRPVAGRVVAAEPHARVVPGRARLVLGVPAHVQLVLAGIETLVQVRGLCGGVPAIGGELHRCRPATPRRPVGDESHAAGVLVVLVTRRHRGHRALLEVLGPDHRRIGCDPLITGVAVGQALRSRRRRRWTVRLLACCRQDQSCPHESAPDDPPARGFWH